MPLFFPLGSASVLKPGIKSTLLFLWHLAWKCRVRLPVLLTVTLLAMDARPRIDIHTEVRELEPDEFEDEDIDEDDDFLEEEGDTDVIYNEYELDEDDDDYMWPLVPPPECEECEKRAFSEAAAEEDDKRLSEAAAEVESHC